jgi:hypothetical protein
MQATLRTDSRIARGGKVLAATAVAASVAAALTLGYAVGHVTAPSGHVSSGPATSTVDMSNGSAGLSASERRITHGNLP